MRFLLINPHYPISETPSPPLGLAYLAGSLERAGVEVRLLDYVVFPYSKNALEHVLKKFLPQIVGVTAVTMNFDTAIGVVKDVKDICPDVLTVMGGPHVSFCAEETLKAHPELDVVVLGEGEETIVELASEADNDRNWGSINGLVYRDGLRLITTPKRDPLTDVNSLPFPSRHLIPLGRYRALGMPVSLTTSRGCPFKCIFCVGRKMVGPKVRYRDPKIVVDELEYLVGLDFPQINIADDLFTAKKEHCLSVCGEIIKRGIKKEWTSFARVDTVSPRVLKKMKEAGCTTVSFGVESANPEILKTIKKGITIDQVIAAVKMCTDVEITPHISFILGLPGETPETLKETMAFGEVLKQMGALYGFHLLAPFPGTEVREESERFEIKILTHDWRQYHANRAIVETQTATRDMLDQIVIEWEDQYDEWLGYVDVQMKKGEATEEEAWQLIKLRHTVLIYELMMEQAIEKYAGEKYGGFSHKETTISNDEALGMLVKRLVAGTGHLETELSHTLGYAVDQGYLKWREKGKMPRWKWVDYL